MYYDKTPHRNRYSRVLSSFTSVCANETRNCLLPLPPPLFRPTLWSPDLACSFYFWPLALILWSPYITQV